MTDIVVLSLEAWDQVWRRNQHLVAGLLRADPTARVLFVEPAADPLYAVLRDRVVPRRGVGLRLGPVLPEVDAGRLWLLQPTKWLPRVVDSQVDARLARSVVSAARTVGLQDPVLWVNDPAGAATLRATGWRALYDITDDWLLADRTPAEHARLVDDEALLLHRAAEVVVCSPTLAATKSSSRPVHLVPNAVDLAAYQRDSRRPADLPAGPVALYVGTVHTDRMDLPLLARTAIALAERATVVCVGPAPLAPTDRERLVAAGVVVLGPRPAETIPDYLRHADVLLVPHLVTPFTQSLDPIKRYEYRAAARPVVATAVAGFADSGMPRLTVAAAADFPAAVLAALPSRPVGADGPGSRAALPPVDTAVPDWSERVGQIREIVNLVVGSRDSRARPTVAIAHDYLTQRGGAERVVLAMRAAFPEATVYTTLYDPAGTYPEFADATVITSPLNRIAVLRRNHRLALPLLAWATGRLRPDADVVLVSSSGWAHGVRTAGRRIVYCHNPARWLYQTDDYLGPEGRRSATKAALVVLRPWLTRWDRRAARSADRYLANSRVVRDRVRAAYGIDATVLPAPHAIAGGDEHEVAALTDWADAGFHLVVSRLLPYKNVEAVVAAFAGMPSRRLVVVGDGPGRAGLVRDLPTNVRVVSGVSDAELRWIYARARALVAPSLEDYGLTPLEAASFGVPTLAFEAGGYLDTVAPRRSGLFFAEPTPAAVTAAVEAGERHTWSPEVIRAHAARFSQEEFVATLRRYVAELAEEPRSR